MFIIKAKIRNKLGKSASRRLRIDNKIPAVIYGYKNNIKVAPISIELDHNKIWSIHNTGNLYNKIIIIKLDHIIEQVQVKAIQYHAYKPKLIHIEFTRKNESCTK